MESSFARDVPAKSLKLKTAIQK